MGACGSPSSDDTETTRVPGEGGDGGAGSRHQRRIKPLPSGAAQGKARLPRYKLAPLPKGHSSYSAPAIPPISTPLPPPPSLNGSDTTKRVTKLAPLPPTTLPLHRPPPSASLLIAPTTTPLPSSWHHTSSSLSSEVQRRAKSGESGPVDITREAFQVVFDKPRRDQRRESESSAVPWAPWVEETLSRVSFGGGGEREREREGERGALARLGDALLCMGRGQVTDAVVAASREGHDEEWARRSGDGNWRAGLSRLGARPVQVRACCFVPSVRLDMWCALLCTCLLQSANIMFSAPQPATPTQKV